MRPVSVSYTHLDVYKRQVRWMLILQEYDLTIEYCKGKENIVVKDITCILVIIVVS